MGSQANALPIPSPMHMTVLADLCYCPHFTDDATEARLRNWDSSPVLMISPWSCGSQLTFLSWEVELDGTILLKHRMGHTGHTLNSGAYCQEGGRAGAWRGTDRVREVRAQSNSSQPDRIWFCGIRAGP